MAETTNDAILLLEQQKLDTETFIEVDSFNEKDLLKKLGQIQARLRENAKKVEDYKQAIQALRSLEEEDDLSV